MNKYIVSKVTGVRFDYNEQLLTRPDLYEVVLEKGPSTSTPKRRGGRPKKVERDNNELDSR